MKRKSQTDKGPPPTQAITAPPTTAKLASVMDSFFNGPARPPMPNRRSGGVSDASAMSKIEAIITGFKEETINTMNGPAKKKRMFLSGCKDNPNGSKALVYNSQIAGQGILFPTQAVESPAALEDEKRQHDGNGGEKKKFVGKNRDVIFNAMHQQTARTNEIAPSFYLTSGDGKETAVGGLQIGQTVEVWGLHLQPKDGNAYLNASGIAAKGSAPALWEVAPNVIEYCRDESMQKMAAYEASRTCDGFFNMPNLTPGQELQVKYCNAFYKQHLESTADRLRVMAEGETDFNADQLKAHETRIRGITPESFADGMSSMWIKGPREHCIAPLVFEGIVPWSAEMPLVQKVIGGRSCTEGLPETFVIPKVSSVELSKNGNAANIEIMGAFVFSLIAALQSLDEDPESNPLVMAPHSIAKIAVMLKGEVGRVGTTNMARMQTAMREMVPYAEMAVFAKVGNTDKGATTCILSEFCNGGLFMDMLKTIPRVSVVVSRNFIKEHMCEGANIFATDVRRTESDLEMPDPRHTRIPDLADHMYQELSTAGWKFSNLDEAAAKHDMNIEFRVIYDGVTFNIKQDKKIAFETAAGEAHLEDHVAASDTKINHLLCRQALVYAILVDKDDRVKRSRI